MIKFRKDNTKLILIYEPDDDPRWVLYKFKENQPIHLIGTYTLNKNILYNLDIGSIDFDSLDNDLEEYEKHHKFEFVIANVEDNYYKLDSNVFSLGITVYIDKDVKIEKKLFTSVKNISVLKKINDILKKDFYIGGSNNENIPYKEYIKLLNKFPNNYELIKYAESRLSGIIREYIEGANDAENSYQKYLNKKSGYRGENLLVRFESNEHYKYETILSKLKKMLEREDEYKEKDWQIEILEIIQLIYPKYISVFQNVPIKDVYNSTTRYLDYALIDVNGNLDIAEIKKPSGFNVVSTTTYRDNHIPMRELSGSIMQVEKYIFYLNKCGLKADKNLSLRYKDQNY